MSLEQILPLVFLLILFAALRWSQRGAPEDSKTSVGQSESLRKFMEALGLPEDAAPPPLVLQNSPQFAKQEPLPLPKPFSPLPEQITLSKPARQAVATQKQAIVKAEIPTEVSVGHSLSFWFRKRNSLRQAIILREVLGPPHALEEEER